MGLNEKGLKDIEITTKEKDSCIHIVPMRHINFINLEEKLNKNTSLFDRIIGFKPTGWTFTSTSKVNKNNANICCSCPFSKHSLSWNKIFMVLVFVVSQTMPGPVK